MPDVVSDFAVAALWGGDCRAAVSAAEAEAGARAEGEAKSRSTVTRWASGTSSMRRKSRVEEERNVAVGSEELKGGRGGERDILCVADWLIWLRVGEREREKRREGGEGEVEVV